MSEQMKLNNDKLAKSAHALREENILAFWNEKDIFNKSLGKDSPKGEFVFYEGPPTANGHPGIHHLEARAFKDAIPRYKTMQGYHVRRKGGWDTHGLPVELQVEKQLGLKSKKEIEKYGVAEFNKKCKESVWTYVHEWEDFTKRIGYWVDLKNPYITYKPDYIESVWNVIKQADNKDLLYKDYKVVPWCPRCGTGLSSHELAQGYEEVKDLTLYVKFEIRNSKSETNSKFENQNSNDKNKTYLLVWTTTPWTLPGNVGLAVYPNDDYLSVEVETSDVPDFKKGDIYIFGKSTDIMIRIFGAVLGYGPHPHEGDLSWANVNFKGKGNVIFKNIKIIKSLDLIGLSYEPLFPFLKDNLPSSEKSKLDNAFKVYAGDFVTTNDGTGIVHIAPMYGQDDFELGTKNNLPKFHLVNDDGTFKKEAGFLAGRFVKEKDENGKPTLDVDIINDLKSRDLFFAQENYKHQYPHCWRCHTPLIYFARDSWYIRMSQLRDNLVKENEGIHWQPEHIKEGRFGEWLREVKDWAISRERYWGTPLPVWSCEKCHTKKVVGSIDEIKKKPKNTYYVMRHGEAEFNVKETLNTDVNVVNHLTNHGIDKVNKTANSLKGKGIDLIIASEFMRTQETAKIVQNVLGLKDHQLLIDKRIHEIQLGKWDGITMNEFLEKFPLNESRFELTPPDGENHSDVKKRVGDFIYDCEKKYEGKTILIVSHGSPGMMLIAVSQGWDRAKTADYERTDYIRKAQVIKLDFHIIPHNEEYELDLHKPFIDEITFDCKCGGEMKRAKEVMDVWFDSGSMPFAQDHYPFENKDKIDGGLFKKAKNYPADFISEAIDQTRGWFYTLHAIGGIMGKGKAYRNVICLGHILDAEGKKMSKSIGNVVNPWEMMDIYGADALRFWMYSVNQPGDSKNFDQKTVDEVVKKVFNLASNVLSFYKMYEIKSKVESPKSKVESVNVIDQWIITRMNQLIENVTKNLDNYVFLEPSREIREFVADLSQWYLRRSRDRFKTYSAEASKVESEDEIDRQSALDTTRYVLETLAKVMAPFTPFFAEYLYREVGGKKESVHMEDWPQISPKSKVQSLKLIQEMNIVRELSSKGLEARTVAKINVRQPLAKLKIKNSKLKIENGLQLVNLIKDEVNVKEVVLDSLIEKDVELDLVITPELKLEGEYRELLRKIQDMRKEKGLSVGDKVSLIVSSDSKNIIDKYKNEIMKLAGVTSIEFGEVLSIR